MTAITITIHHDTFRDAACDGDEALEAFDAHADRIFAAITEKAAAQGLTIVVKDGRSHGPSYTVDAGEDYDAEQAAHDFMQSHHADFWSHL
jgi:hypothetical protein